MGDVVDCGHVALLTASLPDFDPAREGRITGRWETPKGGGRGQKLYALAADGKTALKAMRSAWVGFRDELTAIVGER